MNKFLLLIIFTFSIFADEVVWLGRSPRALLMGDAWTTLANNDEMTLFYNPASLGGNETVKFSPLPMKIGITNALAEMDRFQNFPSSDSAAIADRILGFPIYLELSAFPGLKMLHFGFNLFASSKTSMILRNRVHPSLEIDYRYDRGFVTGFAYNFFGGRNNKGKIASGSRLSLGYGLKYIRRNALKNKFDLMSTGLLEIINAGTSSPGGIREALGESSGKAFGHDLGLEFSSGSGSSEFAMGLSVLNAGGVRFKKISGTAEIPKQDMYVNTGMSFKQDFGLFDYALSMDMKPINGPLSWGRMFSMGAMINMPFLSFYSGWGQGYFNYGAELRFFPITLVAGFYNVELAKEYREQQGKRAFIYLSFFDAEFDVF